MQKTAKPEHLVITGRYLFSKTLADIGQLTNRLTIRDCESDEWLQIG